MTGRGMAKEGVAECKRENPTRMNWRGPWSRCFFRGLDVDDVLGSRAFLAVYYIELNLRTLG